MKRAFRITCWTMLLSFFCATSNGDSVVVEGLSWRYINAGGTALIYTGDGTIAVDPVPSAMLRIPGQLSELTVTRIGVDAFRGAKLSGVEIPDSVVSIGDNAFMQCRYMMSVNMPSVLTSIGTFAFYGCDSLLDFELPEGLATIGRNAFCDCRAISVVTVPSTVREIGAECFAGSTHLSAVYLPEGLEKIEWNMFAGCTNLSICSIPSTVKAICTGAFQKCISLPSFMANDVSLIEENAFSGCKGLGFVVVGSTDKISIRSGAFCNCTSLTNITINGEMSGGVVGFSGCSSLGRFDVPSGASSIVASAFKDCYSLRQISIPRDVLEIGSGAFKNCHSLGVVLVEEGDVDRVRDLMAKSGVDVSSLVVTECKDGEFPNHDSPGAAAYTVSFGGTSLPNFQWKTNHTYALPRFVGWRSNVDGKVYGGGALVSDLADAKESVVMTPIFDSLQYDVINYGFVVATTEITSSGAVAVPAAWTNAYPRFIELFGSDLGAALIKRTGKVDLAGHELCVWQDYVAGTDPTNPDDRFYAYLVFENGTPIVRVTPELTEEQKLMREYKTFGKKILSDDDWIDLTNAASDAMREYNYFKVSVRMKQ